MLGVLLGMRAAIQRRYPKQIGIWLGALMVYPVLMLLLGGRQGATHKDSFEGVEHLTSRSS